MAHKRADEQDAYRKFDIAYEVIQATGRAGRGGKTTVSPNIIAEYVIATGNMVNVLVQIVSDLQDTNTLLTNRVAELMQISGQYVKPGKDTP